jgi:hypothetical protein
MHRGRPLVLRLARSSTALLEKFNTLKECLRQASERQGDPLQRVGFHSLVNLFIYLLKFVPFVR